MAVCIGSICDKAKSVVVAADRMVTLQLPPTEFEHTGSKIDCLTDKVLFLVAGNILPATEILKKTKSKLTNHQNASVEEVAKIVCNAYQEYRMAQVEEFFLKPRCLTLKMFYQENKSLGIPKELALALDNQMVQYNLGVELIVAGTDSAGGHLFTVMNPGVCNCFDKIGFVAIGSGSMHATSAFIANCYSMEFGVNKGVYYASESKIMAERAPGVGAETDIAFISDKGKRFMTKAEIQLLRDSCLKIKTPKIEEAEKIIGNLPFEKDATNESRK